MRQQIKQNIKMQVIYISKKEKAEPSKNREANKKKKNKQNQKKGLTCGGRAQGGPYDKGRQNSKRTNQQMDKTEGSRTNRQENQQTRKPADGQTSRQTAANKRQQKV